MGDEHYDLIVIGSGPAGEKGAAQAAYFGKRVALIEREDALGGAATNTGTLPSKTLRETALHLSGMRQRGFHATENYETGNVSIDDFLFRKRIVTDSERARIMVNLENHQVDRIQGKASFINPHTIQVSNDSSSHQLTGDYILIATGSRPFHPDNFPFSDDAVFDSDTILTIDKIPATMLIIGAGVIGVEYACLFSALGVRVTVVHGSGSILPFLDREMSRMLEMSMEAMGCKLIFGTRVAKFRCAGKQRELQMEDGQIAKADAILVTTGRQSNVDSLHLKAAGVEAGPRGLIQASEHGQTNISHIYAAGDVVGFPALASTSMEQARVAMNHAFQFGYKKEFTQLLPFGIYSIPECSMAGATEEELEKDNIPYVAGRARYNNNARGMIVGDDIGRLKMLFHAETKKILGVHIIGEQATELIHTGLTAMMMDADIGVFIRTCYNYPTLSEMYKYAAYDALGQFPEDTQHQEF
ncbi:MAG: Si-specific NAD(P)(+) transhydrogenase [Verrucomicrobiota bacterium]